jgi:hypothetical protein
MLKNRLRITAMEIFIWMERTSQLKTGAVAKKAPSRVRTRKKPNSFGLNRSMPY